MIAVPSQSLFPEREPERNERPQIARELNVEAARRYLVPEIQKDHGRVDLTKPEATHPRGGGRRWGTLPNRTVQFRVVDSGA